MAKIYYFHNEHIAVYIYGESLKRHHGKHVLVLKTDESCQYDFTGRPVKGTKALRNRSENKLVRDWIRHHVKDLEKAWNDINNGKARK